MKLATEGELALLLRGLGSREYALGLVSGVKSGEGCELMEFDLGLGLGRSCGDPFCFERFICRHWSGRSLWNSSCLYAPASGPFVIRRKP